MIVKGWGVRVVRGVGGYFIRCTPSNGARAAFTDRSWHVNLRGGGGGGRVGSKTRKSFN